MAMQTKDAILFAISRTYTLKPTLLSGYDPTQSTLMCMALLRLKEQGLISQETLSCASSDIRKALRELFGDPECEDLLSLAGILHVQKRSRR